MAINWIKLYKQYKGLWVALKQDEKTVVASGKSAREAYDKALKRGLTDPLLSFVPPLITPMVG